MPSISSYLFFLGLVVASAVADETTTGSEWSITSQGFSNGHISNNDVISVTHSTPDSNTSSNISNTISSISSTTNNMDITNTNSSIEPSTTMQRGGDKEDNITPHEATVSLTTQKPIVPSKSTPATNTNKDKRTTGSQPLEKSDTTGIIILVVIIVIAVIFGFACYFVRKRGRRYSVDLTSRADDANIPLSTVEPDLAVDTVSQNGLQTFESIEITTKEPVENPEVQEEQKAEAAAPAPSPDSSEDKPKEAVAEKSSPAPVEPTVEKKTDDEGTVSNKTSVESLKETNDNNSNNADLTARDLKLGNIFWDVPLDCPV